MNAAIDEAMFTKLYPIVERLIDIDWITAINYLIHDRHMMLKDGQEKLVNKILSLPEP